MTSSDEPEDDVAKLPGLKGEEERKKKKKDKKSKEWSYVKGTTMGET